MTRSDSVTHIFYSMYGIHQSIRRSYNSAKEKTTFLVSFEKDIAILIKTMADCKLIDYDKLRSELRCIANESKKRGYSTKQYLQLIEEFAESAIHGNHQEMIFNKNGLRLE